MSYEQRFKKETGKPVYTRFGKNHSKAFTTWLKSKLEAVEKELKDACMVVYHLDNNIPVSIQRVEKYCDKHREVEK